MQLLGLGRNGHIGFNEPSDLAVDEALRLPTRLVDLHPVTRADAAHEFGSPESVIPRAVLRYEIADNTNVYGSYSKGFKSGGYAGSAGVPGSGRMIALCTKPNCAADPAMPNARASTIVADDNGLRAKNRKAKRTSPPTESIQRAGRTSRASS